MQKIILIIVWVFLYTFSYGQKESSQDSKVKNYTDINNLKQGKWSKPYKSGKTAYIATFKNDKLIGLYQRFYPSGKLMLEIKYDENGNESGPAILYYDNGEISAKGFYINRNVRDSTWNLYNTDRCLVATINYKAGKRNGKEIYYWKSGQKCMEKDWVDGKENGVWREFFENGNDRLKARMINGKRNGLFAIYHPNGRYFLKGYYKNNIREKHWVYYERDGKIRKELDYVHGHAKNEDEIDRARTKEILEWEKVKGEIPEPNIENMLYYEKKYRPLSK